VPDITFLVIAGTAVLLGSMVQGSLGLGLGLVAAPVVTLLEPALMPGAMITATVVLPLLTLCAEWRHVDWHGLAWGLPARIPGAVAGTWLVAVATPRVLGLVVGAMVLLAVAVTLWSVRIRITPLSLMLAGVTSGLAGTTTSIGGPPIAVLYQHSAGPTVRATLGGFFFLGTVISLLTLGLGGQLTTEQAGAGLALIPFVLGGYLASLPLRRRFAMGGIRTALLAVVTFSGVALIAHAVT
jgi:hypothetical protein